MVREKKVQEMYRGREDEAEEGGMGWNWVWEEALEKGDGGWRQKGVWGDQGEWGVAQPRSIYQLPCPSRRPSGVG